MSIKKWLQHATHTLQKAGIPSARLDAELLLAGATEHERVYLHAHDKDMLSEQQLLTVNAMLGRRAQRLPMAYILGRKEFYGRELSVSPNVLIPRPETETLIELLPDLSECVMIDVGTGSGAIAITAKLEHPIWAVTGCDIDEDALLVAAQNADRLNARIALRRSNLLTNISGVFNIITANLPYVDREWERSPETDYEPALALFADEQGLALIRKLLQQVPTHLAPHGQILLEADPEQHAEIIRIAQKNNLQHIRTEGYITVFQKM